MKIKTKNEIERELIDEGFDINVHRFPYTYHHDYVRLAPMSRSDAAQKLIISGAQGIVLCANTLHMFANRLQMDISVPIIHIAEATARVRYSNSPDSLHIPSSAIILWLWTTHRSGELEYVMTASAHRLSAFS